MQDYQTVPSKKNNHLFAALLCAAGLLINILGVRLALKFDLPLFLDNIGGALTAALGGYIPAIIVGFLTNLINGIGDYTTTYYGSLSVLIAVSAAYYAGKGYFSKLSRLPLIILTFSLIGGGLGSVLTWVLYGFDFGTGISAPLAHRIFESGALNQFWSQFCADMLIDLLDKTITVLVVALVLRVLPESIKTRCSFSGWKQTPINRKALQEAEKGLSCKKSLRAKIIMIVAAAMVIIAVAVTAISYINFREAVINEKTAKAQSTALAAKKPVDAEQADDLISQGEAAPDDAAVDIDMESVSISGYQFLARVVSLFFGFFVMILTVAIWLTEYNVILPINAMALTADHYSFETEENRADAVKQIKNLNISTDDEIENLYRSVVKTTEDVVRSIEQVEQQKEVISKLQNGLILVLADMVESRDKCTGDHVRKTAAYADVIMHQLKKEGIYADQLTEEFMEDVVNSAPLHDVGKIHVPDSVLNKPGRLTEDEFNQIKQHTTSGSEIISRAIDMVSEGDEGFLKEAKNLALYHHEKWNGKGYPVGLNGAEIPLSARIMAVADVFDALVSRRSYKEGLSMEQAMEIIHQSSGTHFDPRIVSAFEHANDKVEQIMRSHREQGIA